jgi:hypothetical protein
MTSSAAHHRDLRVVAPNLGAIGPTGNCRPRGAGRITSRDVVALVIGSDGEEPRFLRFPPKGRPLPITATEASQYPVSRSTS